MKEVSCKALDVFFQELKKKKLPPEVLVEGTPYDVATLRNKNERIDWSIYTTILSNAGRIWSEPELLEMGASFLKSPIVRSLTLIARLLFNALDFYRWTNNAKSGAGRLLFTCVHPSQREVGPNRLILELTLEEGCHPSREFFIMSKGGIAALPRLLGLPSSVVEMTPLERGASFDITYPSGGATLAFLWRIVSWPFLARAAAVELKEANELLQSRYQELDEARNGLALQATQLSTAHSISQLLRGDLDLQHTLRAVASALVDVAGFSSVMVHVACEVEGHPFDQSAREGEPPATDPMRVPLEGRGRTIGELHLWTGGGANDARLRELLQVVLPTITLALEDALTHAAVLDYRQNLEQKVVERTTQLSQARDSLAETVAKMVQAQAARDRIFANINHEIRTPLSLVMLSVAQIKKRQWHRLDDKAREDLGSIELAGRKLLRLIDGLLLLAAGQEGTIPLRRMDIDLAEKLQLVVAAWRQAAEADRLALTYRGPARCTITVDEDAVERIVTNLLSNAIKFTPDGGSIDLELSDGPESVQIAVRDTGLGIDEEFRSRIFGRFEQGARPVRPGAHGSGIGLSLVKELTEAHGGEVVVESSRAGSLFRVTLPRRSRLPAVEPSEARAPEGLRLLPDDYGLHGATADSPTVFEAHGQARALVLIAEDEPDLRHGIAEMLRDDYRVVLAPDGLSALRLAQRHVPDLLVSDVNMPGMDGLELTRRFRELPGNRLAPVVLLTAYTGIADRLSGFEAGAIDYIVKPFEPEELRARIRSQLELRATALKLHQSEKLAALGTLSAGLAHEMRNPANAMVNAIEPLAELLPPELLTPEQPVAQLLEVMRTCADQVARLSRQLLGFKRSGELERNDSSATLILSRALALVQPSLVGIALREETAYGGPISCASSLVIQVIANLLENAAYAAGLNGWVRIASRSDGELLVVEVSDSGAGVPIELRERIFEPFFTTKPPGAGTGLGLTTSREIAARHGGLLDVREGPDGSCFHLEIPGVPTAAASLSGRRGVAS